MIKKSSKLGFTMAEMMVCLSVIAVIATILIPTIAALRPDKEKTMFKKAYQITERVVSELVNDPDLYPNDPEFFGFDNIGVANYNGIVYGAKYLADSDKCDGEIITEEDKEDCDKISDSHKEAKRKFCALFGSKLNLTEKMTKASPCFEEEAIGEDNNGKFNKTFTTTDGIAWSMPATYFTGESGKNNPEDGSKIGGRTPVWTKIVVDINGDKEPNILDNESASPVSCGYTGNVDRFTIYVRSDGKVAVMGACAKAYLTSSKIIPEQINGATGEVMPNRDKGKEPHLRGGDDSEWWNETKPVENEQPSTP